MNFVSLTSLSRPTIVELKQHRHQNNYMAENQLKALEQKIDELITLCGELNRENMTLKADSASWQRERQDLVDKNELARTKVAAMIDRLRTMEQQA